jgi:PST family polysaccharide transporter/teichuronic acid exporter/lipopolysaccharide exporter
MLKQKIFNSIKWNGIALLSRAILHFIQLLLTTYYLIPSDVGILAIVFALMTFAQTISDGGINQSIIYNQHLNEYELGQIYFFNLLISTCISFILTITSPLIAFIYKSDKLIFLLILISIIIFINSTTQILKTLAQKKLAFQILSKIEISSNIIGLMTAYISFHLNLSIYAPVFGLLASVISSSMMTWIFIKPQCNIKFNLDWNFRKIYSSIIFGLEILGANIVDSITSKLDILIGGLFLNSAHIGLYSLAKEINLRISSTINPIITKIMFPVMAEHQNNTNEIKKLYTETLSIVNAINIPIYIIILFYSYDIIILFFNEEWLATLPLLKILSIWGIFNATGNPVGILLTAKGKSKLALYWNIALLPITAIFVFLGSLINIQYLAISMSILFLITYIPSWYFLIYPVCKLDFLDFFKTLLQPFILSFATAMISYLIVSNLDATNLHFIIGLLVFNFIYFYISYKLNLSWFHIISSFFNHNKRIKSCVV